MKCCEENARGVSKWKTLKPSGQRCGLWACTSPERRTLCVFARDPKPSAGRVFPAFVPPRGLQAATGAVTARLGLSHCRLATPTLLDTGSFPVPPSRLRQECVALLPCTCDPARRFLGVCSGAESPDQMHRRAPGHLPCWFPGALQQR